MRKFSREFNREFNGRENDQNPPVAMLNREYPNARKKDAGS